MEELIFFEYAFCELQNVQHLRAYRDSFSSGMKLHPAMI